MMNPKFHGWHILAASFLILVIDGGVRFSFGVLIKPLAAEFGWERGSITFAYTLNMLVFAFCQPLAGKLLDRFGAQRLFSLAALATTAGLALTSQTHSLADFYVYYGVITAAATAGVSISVISSTLASWFKELRVFISGVAISGAALGQFLFIPLIALALERFGWRWTWALLAMAVSLVIVPLSLLVIRRDPSQTVETAGQIPDDGRSSGSPFKAMASPGVAAVVWSKDFLLIAASYFACGFQDFLFVTQMIAFATDQGMSAQAASNLQGTAGLLSIPGLLIFAVVSEKLGRKVPLFLTFGPRLLCFALLIVAHGALPITVSALLFGFTLMGLAPLGSTLVGELYGFQHIGTLTGIIFWIHHLGGAMGAYTGGVTHDLTGSYAAAFTIALALAAAALVTSAAVGKPKSQNQVHLPT